MKEEIKKSIDYLVEMGYITLNPNVTEETIINEIAARTLNLSFQDFKKWYLN